MKSGSRLQRSDVYDNAFRSRPWLAVALAITLLLLGSLAFISYTGRTTDSTQLISLKALTSEVDPPVSVERTRQIATCKDLLRSVLSGKHLTTSDSTLKQAQLMKELNAATGEVTEGHSGQMSTQTQMYMNLASIPCVKTICEIGFNAGHSAVTWLSARDDTILISFDLGFHGYGVTGVNFVKSQFPGRHIMMYGNSTATVSSARRLLEHKCDIAVVDGGHDYATALADILNMRELATRDFHIFVIDDVNCTPSYCVDVEKAMAHVTRQNMLQVFYNVSFQSSTRGFSVGEYLWN